jgi:hypothetical protein
LFKDSFNSSRLFHITTSHNKAYATAGQTLNYGLTYSGRGSGDYDNFFSFGHFRFKGFKDSQKAKSKAVCLIFIFFAFKITQQ